MSMTIRDVSTGEVFRARSLASAVRTHYGKRATYKVQHSTAVEPAYLLIEVLEPAGPRSFNVLATWYTADVDAVRRDALPTTEKEN